MRATSGTLQEGGASFATTHWSVVAQSALTDVPEAANAPAAKKALELDDSLAEAHMSLGLLLFYVFDFQGATKEFERAIALNPNYATAHHWYGLGPLRCVGDFDKAIAELKRALQLDPLSLIINADLGAGLVTARSYGRRSTWIHIFTTRT